MAAQKEDGQETFLTDLHLESKLAIQNLSRFSFYENLMKLLGDIPKYGPKFNELQTKW